jgi:predicted transcriptional regulator
MRRETVQVRLDPVLLAQLDRLSVETGLNRSWVLRAALVEGLASERFTARIEAARRATL